MFTTPQLISVEDSYSLFEQLQPWASAWLHRGGLATPLHLARWARAEDAFISRNGQDCVVMVTNWYPDLKATLHPLFRSARLVRTQKQGTKLLNELSNLLRVQRLELQIGSTRTRSVKRLAEKLGFAYEGTLRRANRLSDNTIEDLEIWSWLKAKE